MNPSKKFNQETQERVGTGSLIVLILVFLTVVGLVYYDDRSNNYEAELEQMKAWVCEKEGKCDWD